VPSATTSCSPVPDRTEIAVIGAGGFLGKHLIEHLLAHGRYQVLGVDASGEGLAAPSPGGLTFYQADVRHAPDVLEQVIRRACVVVDLIAYGNPGMYVTGPLDVFETHFLPSLEVAKLCIRHRRRLIHCSSAEVYGKAAPVGGCSEDMSDSVFDPAQDQRWLPAGARILLERLLHAYGTAEQLNVTTVRPFDMVREYPGGLVPTFGGGGHRLVQAFLPALGGGKPLHVLNGDHIHHYVMHVEDATAAFQLILDHPEATRGQTYNLGNPDNHLTLSEAAAILIELYEELSCQRSTSRIVRLSADASPCSSAGDSAGPVPDIAKIRSLGWTPRHDVRSTLRDVMRSLRDWRPAAPLYAAETRQPVAIGAS
jgi:UDP-apiose/xylose synthase